MPEPRPTFGDPTGCPAGRRPPAAGRRCWWCVVTVFEFEWVQTPVYREGRYLDLDLDLDLDCGERLITVSIRTIS